jgi:hypothetical protein
MSKNTQFRNRLNTELMRLVSLRTDPHRDEFTHKRDKDRHERVDKRAKILGKSIFSKPQI